MRKRSALFLSIFSIVFLVFALAGCSKTKAKSNEKKTVKVGVVGENNQVWKPIIKKFKKQGVTIKLVKFSDYIKPNTALAEGDIDLNAYQGYVLMDDYNKNHGNVLSAIGETTLNPIGLYSKKAKSVKKIPANSTIAIPNDTVNAARALLLLQSAGLIKLKDVKTPGTGDITSNPKNFKIKEVEASQTARVLPDVGASVINVFMALDAGFNPTKQALYNEPVNAKSKPYYNIIVSRSKDKNNKLYKQIVAAYQSNTSKKIIKKLYKGAVIPLWK
ncbi:MetQ/NlpA family ABC transporter substrate-binding protein [Liquorilactobacillus hordei]|uniref:MetQ/NlpA family ABC transporter substrate-binding protein n=1 Tax=Liquorilactobacillus hordei TaxID=468911 RepID=UPI001CBCB769|nr:MetQ/NlpA family ABC transporter substrate-binding protein [Liquorilactobacillus hordei]MBZ2406162.1 metal ABC transporter substrate-binding protein [Liquorilactobacillus hordei]